MEIGQSQLSKDILLGITSTLCITVAALYLPVAGIFFGLLIPLPLIFYRIKLGSLISGVILCAVLTVLWLIFGKRGLQSGAFFLYFGLTGIILAEAFTRNLSVEKTVLATVGVVIAAGMAMLFGYWLFSEKSLWDIIMTYLSRNLELTIALYREMETSPEKLTFLQNSQELIFYIFLRIIPGIVVAFTLFTVWANLLMVRPILKKGHLFCPDFGPLNRWRSPDNLVWFAISSGILLLLPSTGLKLLGLNGLIVLMVVYLFQGLAIISYYFEKKQFPPLLRGVIYALVAVQQLLILTVIAVGFFDAWADFRRLKKEEKKLEAP